VLVRLLGGPTKVAWFVRTTPITETWDEIRDGVRQGARVLGWPSGREVAVDATLGEIVEGNQVTLEVRSLGVGGGEKEDYGALSSSVEVFVGDNSSCPLCQWCTHEVVCMQSSSSLRHPAL